MKTFLVKTKSALSRARVWVYCHPAVMRAMMTLTMIFVSREVIADGAIPTPDAGDDPTQGGKDFLDILKNIIQKQAGPILVYGGALFFIVLAVFDIYRGYKKYQDTDDFGKFKMALVTGAILVVIGLVLFFLGQYILRQWVNN
jgi:hypothetical protein